MTSRLRSILFQEEEESSSSSLHSKRNNTFQTLKRKLGISLYVLFIIIFVAFFAITTYTYRSYPQYVRKINEFFYGTSIFYTFMFLSLLIFIFGLVQIIYFFSVKKYNDSHTDRRVLLHTYSGYILLIVAYIILTVAFIWNLFVSLLHSDTILTTHIIFAIIGLVVMILLCIGLAESSEPDSGKGTKGAAIMAPVFITIQSLMIGIIPILCKMNLYENSGDSPLNIELLSGAFGNASRTTREYKRLPSNENNKI